MEYTVGELARLSGVSARTLRYYDRFGLLVPAAREENGYRVYGPAEVDLLQQILFYRAVGMPLEEIRAIVTAPGFDREAALERQLSALQNERARVEAQIETLHCTLEALKGEKLMEDSEKFACFKEQAIADNESAYGAEVRKQFGDDVMDASNEKVRGMTQEAWNGQEECGKRILALLREVVTAGDAPDSERARETCTLHRQWLEGYWPAGAYTPEAHRQLAAAYVADERFRTYYDAAAPGAADFLQRAIETFAR